MLEPNNIYLGDCYELIKQIPDSMKICLVTDPPFNVGYHYDGYKDNIDEEKYYQWLSDIVLSHDSPFVVIHYPESIYKLALKIGRVPEKVATWCYNSNTSKQHRDIAYFGLKPDFTKVRQPYKNPTDKRVMERIKNGSGGGRLYDWWEINQVKNVSEEKYDHPCIMPLEVMKRVVGIIPDDYVIVDTFMGSGTTLKACQELNRKYIGMEINPKYYNIAKDRLNNINAKGEVSLF